MIEPAHPAPASAATTSGAGPSREPTNLGDILERVLDRGLVIAGDIQVSLLDIELLTIKLRLLIASVDTAKQLGINWWEHDPWLTANQDDLREENRRLRERVQALESGRGAPALEDGDRAAESGRDESRSAEPDRRRP